GRGAGAARARRGASWRSPPRRVASLSTFVLSMGRRAGSSSYSDQGSVLALEREATARNDAREPDDRVAFLRKSARPATCSARPVLTTDGVTSRDGRLREDDAAMSTFVRAIDSVQAGDPYRDAM